MAKKKKMIEIDDLLAEEQLNNKNNDMIFVSATNDTSPSLSEKVHKTRLERIRDSAVIVDEPLFDGEIDLDMGMVTMRNEEDTIRIKKNLVKQQNISDASEKQKNSVVKEMHGLIPEDVVENFNLDVNTVPLDNIKRTAEKKANSKAVQEILDALHKKR